MKAVWRGVDGEVEQEINRQIFPVGTAVRPTADARGCVLNLNLVFVD